MLDTSDWKDVVGYEGRYKISPKGEVYSFLRKGKLLKIPLDKDGYQVISMAPKNGLRKLCKVHRLVGLTYIDNPENLPCINHKNGIKTDNRVENLEWCTVKHNNVHTYKELGKKIPEGLTQSQKDLAIEMLTFSRSGNFIPSEEPFPLEWVAKCFGVCSGVIRKIKGFPPAKFINLREKKRRERAKMGGQLRGVTFCKDKNKYRTTIRIDGRTIFLGLFPTKEEAYQCYYDTSLEWEGKEPWAKELNIRRGKHEQ